MRYVIWGCGDIGSRVVQMLGGTRKVAAIVEGSKKLQGTTYCGIPIISFDDFLSRYSAYPVIVTPIAFEDEIMEQLKRSNVIGAFSFLKERAQVESLLVQRPIGQILKQYKANDHLAVYGASLLALILYDIFFDNGIEVSLVVPSNTSFSLKQYIEDTLKIKTAAIDEIKKNNMKLLLASELKEDDQNKTHGMTYDKYYDMHLREELFYNPELEKFMNIHEGKRCFIVATGPSLRISDLDRLYDNGEICISVNGIFNAFDKTKWRPDYYIVADPTADVLKNKILGLDVQAKFVSDVIAGFDDQHYDNVYRWHLIRQSDEHGFPYFSDNYARGGYFGNTVVYDGALQLAAYMGFREIYLLGTDCTRSPEDGHMHFYSHDLGGEPECNRETYLQFWGKKIMRSYQVAKRYADSHNIKIYNATRGGELEIFPRVDFDTLFS